MVRLAQQLKPDVVLMEIDLPTVLALTSNAANKEVVRRQIQFGAASNDLPNPITLDVDKVR